jgi:hypothetical protein
MRQPAHLRYLALLPQSLWWRLPIMHLRCSSNVASNSCVTSLLVFTCPY